METQNPALARDQDERERDKVEGEKRKRVRRRRRRNFMSPRRVKQAAARLTDK